MNNTLKNVGFCLFSLMILIAYNVNLNDIINQNGYAIACCVELILLSSLALLISKLIKEL